MIKDKQGPNIDAIFELAKQEGNYEEWIYKEKYPCRIIRSLGNWCGYCSVPKSHPCFGMNHDNVDDKYDISVHGGLTYSDGLYDVEEVENPNEREEVIKQYRLKKEDTTSKQEYWELGFDTAHADDILLCDRRVARLMGDFGTYKTKNWTINETNDLARQLEQIEKYGKVQSNDNNNER